MPLGQGQDLIHLAGHSRIMNHDNGPGAPCDQPADLLFIDVQRVRPDVAEHRPRPPQHKGIGGGDKRVSRHDHLVPLPDIQQDGRHLQGMRAGGGQKSAPASGELLQQLFAFFGKGLVAGNLAGLHRLADIIHLPALQGGLVKGNAETFRPHSWNHR